MQKAALLSMSLSEETLTEWSLYNVALAHQGAGIIIDLATKQEEAQHGGDWEWWFVRNKKAIGFRVQAKRLFSNGSYNSLLKAKPKQPYEQLDTLIAGSVKDNLVPLYCFFNFAQPKGHFNHPKNACAHSYRGPSFWGCSIASPEKVKQAKSNELAKLKPLMQPWHCLVCQSESSDLLSAASSFLAKFEGTDVTREPRALPQRVARLIDIATRNRRREYSTYVDYDYWQGLEMDPAIERLAGIIAIRDER
jgi:hypothetical protein